MINDRRDGVAVLLRRGDVCSLQSGLDVDKVEKRRLVWETFDVEGVAGWSQ